MARLDFDAVIPAPLAALCLAAVAGFFAWPGAAATVAPEPAPPFFVDCRGAPTASPTVILEAGAFGASADWDYVLNSLSAGGRVCAYDRAGIGRSRDRPARGVDVISRARQLGELLDQIHAPGRVILVGHSNGALYAAAFATLFPGRVAGLAYINGVGDDDLDDPLLIRALAGERRMSNLMVTVARFGLAPLVADAMIADQRLDGAAAARKHLVLTCHACLEVERDEDRQIIPGLTTVRNLGDVARHIPTAVIVGDPNPRDRLALAWRAAQVAPARRADHGWILDAPGASHVSPLAGDGDYIDAAVGWLRREAAP